MIRKAMDTLSAKLSDGLSLSNSRLETFCLLVVGIASVRTVNLSHISGEMPTQAKVESTYRRLQRFFQYVVLGEDWSARLVIRMLGLSGNWNLCLDRTNWKRHLHKEPFSVILGVVSFLLPRCLFSGQSRSWLFCLCEC